MNQNKTYEMKIESEAFDSLREDLNKIIQRTLANMEKKESQQAVINMKLTITLEEAVVPDYETGGGTTREILKPTLEHKIGSVMQIKDEESGTFKGNYELVWDHKKGDYVLRGIDDGQFDMFTERDEDGNIIYDPEYGEKEETQMLADGEAHLLGEGEGEEEEDE